VNDAEAFGELGLVEEKLRQIRRVTAELLETGPIDGPELGDYIRGLERRRGALRKQLGLPRRCDRPECISWNPCPHVQGEK
jgi:hypothetical protein